MRYKRTNDQKRVLFNRDYRSTLGDIHRPNLIIADPPYNLGLEEWDVNFNFEELMTVIAQKLELGGSALIFNILPNVLDMYQIAESLDLYVHDLLIWSKPNFPPRFIRSRGYLNKNREFILWVGNTKTPQFQLKPDELYHKGVFEYPSPAFTNESTQFAYQKPRALIDDLVLRHTLPGSLVMDLFAGSGVVAKSCKQWNRRYIGFELDPDQYDRIDID